MTDILKPDKTSRENILLFLDSIDDEELRKVMIDNLDHILMVGADIDSDRNHRNTFFQAISQLIESRITGDE